MEIPKQLKNCKFIKTTTEKRPTETNWPTTNNYEYKKFTPTSDTYGVLCGHKGLIVIDCDDKEIQDKLLTIPEISETFTVKTAIKGLYHFYLYTEQENPETFRIDNKQGKRIIDLQGKGTQVIGPGSKIDSRKYEIVNPREINTINYEYLKQILINIDENAKIIKKEKKKENATDIEFDETCKAIKQKIPITTFLKNPEQNPTMCPLGHTSEGGACFHHTGNVWYCHHCHQTGNVIQLYQKINNTNFKTARANLAKQAGLIDEIERKILMLYSDQKTRSQATELVVEEFLKLNQIRTLRTDKDPEMWIYRNGIYQPEGRTYIKEYVQAILKEAYTSHVANQVIEKIIAKTYIKTDDFFAPEDLDKVPVTNGILDIKHKKLEPFNEKYRFFSKLPVIYDPLITPEEIPRFFNEVLKSKEDIDNLQELFGYLLYRDYKFEKAWMFTGSGRNGKGKTIELMEQFIGTQHAASVDLKDLENKTFISGNLFNKLANLAGDINSDSLEKTALFKKLTGHDLIQAERKFLTPVFFRNYAKMIFAANELPYSIDDSEGFWDRWILIQFPYKFVDDPKEPHHKPIDRNKIRKLTTDKEMSGLLNWALVGFERLMSQGRFTISTSTEEVQKVWKRKSSSLIAFLEEHVEKTSSSSDRLLIGDFNFYYNQYCEEHGLESDSPQQRNKIFRKMAIADGRKDGQRCYIGIRFKGIVLSVEEEISEDDLL